MTETDDAVAHLDGGRGFVTDHDDSRHTVITSKWIHFRYTVHYTPRVIFSRSLSLPLCANIWNHEAAKQVRIMQGVGEKGAGWVMFWHFQPGYIVSGLWISGIAAAPGTQIMQTTTMKYVQRKGVGRNSVWSNTVFEHNTRSVDSDTVRLHRSLILTSKSMKSVFISSIIK